ncbi:MAG TPA: phospholipase D-like domain-containing protein [Gemmatimonadales bacterium]|nr:phospholipase D-like domain-containing protein [Gemmatimonadales bacterium]
MEWLVALPWWGVTLIGVGALAVIMAISALFLPDFHEPDFIVGADPAADSPEFLDVLVGALNVPVLRGGTATVLQNGAAFFPAMLDAIRRARDSVNFQCYIWESGRISDQFIEAFSDAAKRGVEVRILIDAFGAIKFRHADRERLRAAGCRLEFFRPIRWYSLVRAFRRSHQRAITMDGRVGFTGGAAIADKWDGNAGGPEEWRDSMTMVTGALVSGIQTAFSNDWVYCCGEILTGPRFYPAPSTGGAGLEPDMREAEAPPPGDAVGFAVVSSPSDAEQPIRICHWLSFRSARRTLYISNSYFIPDRRLRKAVMERARAGVDVRILVPGSKTDAIPVRLAGQTHYEELMRAGVRIYEYQPTMMHAKVVVVDGVWSVVGSANMDERSMELNEENVLSIYDPGLAGALEQGFHEDFERSIEFELARWSRRPLYRRILERLSRAAIEQY